MGDSRTPVQTQAWQALKVVAEEIAGMGLRQLFAQDPARVRAFAPKAQDLFLDYFQKPGYGQNHFPAGGPCPRVRP